MPILRSQTVYLSITVFLSLALSQQHTLMCLALSQHHAALALSCALLCLSITLLLLSHVPCFVSASRCSCSLMCLALSQHHAALALSCALLCLSITLLLHSHVPCFVSASRCTAYHASLTPFLLSLMCLICLVTVLVHVHCFVSTSRRSYVLRCLRVSRCSSSAALYVPCFVQLSITMLSQVLHLSITPLMCLALSQHDITPLFSALPFLLDIFPGYSTPRCYKSNELEINGSEIL